MHSSRRTARLHGNSASIVACLLIGRAEWRDTQGKHVHAQSSQHPSNVNHLLVAPDGATLLIHQRRALRRDSSIKRLVHTPKGAHQQCVTCHAAPSRRGSIVSRLMARLFASHDTGHCTRRIQSTEALPHPSRRMARQRAAHATAHPQFTT